MGQNLVLKSDLNCQKIAKLKPLVKLDFAWKSVFNSCMLDLCTYFFEQNLKSRFLTTVERDGMHYAKKK